MIYKCFPFALLAAIAFLFSEQIAYANTTGDGDQPLSGRDTIHLSIATNYVVFADTDVIISQIIKDTLPGALKPIISFGEIIRYNPNILEFIDVRNGANTPAPDWFFTKSVTTPGILYVTGNSTSSASLKGPGEILQMLFHVLSQAPTFSSSSFIIDSAGASLLDPIAVSDTGRLLVIDACSPVVTSGAVPTSSIMQCTPNPASGTILVSYFIAEDSGISIAPVTFQLYNSAGVLSRSLSLTNAGFGWHEFPINLTGMSDGVYSLEFQAGASHEFQRLIILH
jgi:hypothetical protein